MRVGEYDVRVLQRKRSVMINVKRDGSAHSHDMVIHDSLLGIAPDIINAVIKEKEEANG